MWRDQRHLAFPFSGPDFFQQIVVKSFFAPGNKAIRPFKQLGHLPAISNQGPDSKEKLPLISLQCIFF